MGTRFVAMRCDACVIVNRLKLDVVMLNPLVHARCGLITRLPTPLLSVEFSDYGATTLYP